MLLFLFVVRTRQVNKLETKFLGGLRSLGKNWGYCRGLQKRGEREIGGFTMQQRGIYEHIAEKAWREWWTNIYGNHALLLLLPMKQHATQMRKHMSKCSFVASGKEQWTTVMLLRKSERKLKQNKTKTSSPVHDGMKPAFNVLFCLESQKSNKCQAFRLSLN